MRNYSSTMDQRMFDFKAFYDMIVEEMPQDATLVEVGVAEGASAIYLAEALLNRGKRFKLYLVDDLAYGDHYQLRTLMLHIGKAGIGEWVEIVPRSSVEASCMFPDYHFNFVFIDASHRYEWTKADIILWYRKMKENCILAGHDYNREEGAEVRQAVNEIIPKEARTIHQTAKELGIWSTRKSYLRKLC